MNSFLSKHLSTLRANIWMLAAFLIPLAIRSIPEILSWPYPLGVDTLRYINIFESGQVLSSALTAFHYQLFYSLTTFFYGILPNGVLIIKLLGPFLLGLLSLMMFLYAKVGLGWGNAKSLMVALLVCTYFVSLRNSWDLYSQAIGVIFLLATLIVLQSSNSSYRYIFAFVFMVLTVLSHELPSVILFFVLGLEAIRLLIARKVRWDFVYVIITGGLALGLFLLKHYYPSIGSVVIPAADATSSSFASTLLLMGGLLLYFYGFLLPFIALGFSGLKDLFLRGWATWCLLAVLLIALFPTLPLYYWYRWVYLLVYPLLFFAVEGLDKLWHFWASHKIHVRRLAPKVLAIAYIFLLLALSGFYLAEPPEHQIQFFSTYNPYLAYMPSSMLQNTLPISDNPSLDACLSWISTYSTNDSAVVIHYALYDLAVIYVHQRTVIPVFQNPSMTVHPQNETTLVNGLIEASKDALKAGNSTVYTVWWISGDGWYKIPSLPSEFREVFHSDRMGVYMFDPRLEPNN